VSSFLTASAQKRLLVPFKVSFVTEADSYTVSDVTGINLCANAILLLL